LKNNSQMEGSSRPHLRIAVSWLLLMLIVVSQGCFYHRYVRVPTRVPPIKIEGLRPVVPIIPASKLAPLDEETRDIVIKTVKDLQHYIKKLEAAIAEYNKFAAENNIKAEEAIDER